MNDKIAVIFAAVAVHAPTICRFFVPTQKHIPLEFTDLALQNLNNYDTRMPGVSIVGVFAVRIERRRSYIDDIFPRAYLFNDHSSFPEIQRSRRAAAAARGGSRPQAPQVLERQTRPSGRGSG